MDPKNSQHKTLAEFSPGHSENNPGIPENFPSQQQNFFINQYFPFSQHEWTVLTRSTIASTLLFLTQNFGMCKKLHKINYSNPGYQDSNRESTRVDTK